MIERFESDSLEGIYKKLAKKDADLARIIREHGYPPLWVRPNTFETLVLTILEQQVSLASAYAAYKKLKEKIRITPTALLSLSDEDLRSCYFSRQKIVYTRGLAEAILNKTIRLKWFEEQPDDVVRTSLKALKGIGDWTVDIYLIHALRRLDVFPLGDLALVNAIRLVKNDPAATKQQLEFKSEQWKPYRTAATMLFWHHYIKVRNIRLLH